MSALAPTPRLKGPVPSTPGNRVEQGPWVPGSPGCVSPAVIVLAWQVLSSTGILSEQTIAPPAQIATRAGQLAADGTLGAATLTSVQRVLIGFAVGAAFGLVLAVLAGLSRIGEDVVDPPMQMLRTLPHFGLIPLFIVWMGIGESPKIALIAMGCGVPALSEHLRRNPQHRPADDGGRGDDGPDPPPAPTSRGDPGRPPAGARGTSAEPRSRLAHADRRRDDQCRLRPRLHDQQRSRVPADRHHRGRPSRLQHPGPPPMRSSDSSRERRWSGAPDRQSSRTSPRTPSVVRSDPGPARRGPDRASR